MTRSKNASLQSFVPYAMASSQRKGMFAKLKQKTIEEKSLSAQRESQTTPKKADVSFVTSVKGPIIPNWRAESAIVTLRHPLLNFP